MISRGSINWYLLSELVKQQITIRYRRTLLGYLWTLLNPLLMMSVSTLVFSSIFKMDIKQYAVLVFSGVVPFTLFSTILAQSAASLIQNESLLKKARISLFFFPLAVSLALTIDNLLMLLSLFIVGFFIGAFKLTLSLFYLFPAYILLCSFAFGAGLIACVIATYFRDFVQILVVFTQALLFLSPVYFKPTSLSAKVSSLMAYNPLTYFISLFRDPLMNRTPPDPYNILISTFFALLSLSLGLYCFRLFKRKLIYIL